MEHTNKRFVKIYEDLIHRVTAFSNLKKNDIFEVFEEDGSKMISDYSMWIAESDYFLNTKGIGMVHSSWMF